MVSEFDSSTSAWTLEGLTQDHQYRLGSRVTGECAQCGLGPWLHIPVPGRTDPRT